MRILVLFAAILVVSVSAAGPPTEPEKRTALQLSALARQNPGALEGALRASFPERSLNAGTAWLGYLGDFFFATKAAVQPLLYIDGRPGPVMRKVRGGDLWYAAANIQPLGAVHSFHYVVNGSRFGGSVDLPAYGPLSEEQPGVPAGKLLGPLEHVSRIYPGMKSKYWIYVPAQHDPAVATPFMVFHDGEGYSKRSGNHRVLIALDNLIAQKRIPVMIAILVEPGDISGVPGTPLFDFVKRYSDEAKRSLAAAMRSVQYDTVSDRNPRFLRDELLPEVAARYKLRTDAYSRGIAGLSSGALAAFNAAWYMPDQFSRVITWEGSFTNIQWRRDPTVSDGAQDYPDKVLREPKRNVRIWLQDGAEDMEHPSWGSWPLANIRMANALKLTGYDFRFSFGCGSHNLNHGGAEFPAQMTWLWRGYDPARTAETFTQDASEAAKPLFRVSIVNRDTAAAIGEDRKRKK